MFQVNFFQFQSFQKSYSFYKNLTSNHEMYEKMVEVTAILKLKKLY